MSRPSPFARALQAFPPEIAAELEDHLWETAARLERAGQSPEEAQREALTRMGSLDVLRRELLAIPAAQEVPWWCQARHRWVLRGLAAGWILLGLFLVSRVCTHPDPTYATIALSIVSGVASAGAGLALRRRWTRIRPWVTGLAAVCGVCFLSHLVAGVIVPASILPLSSPPVLLAAALVFVIASLLIVNGPPPRARAG